VADLRFKALPATAVEEAKSCLLDTAGCCFYGTQLEWSQIVHRYAQEFSSAHHNGATVMGFNTRSDPRHAALVNGTLAHSFELDDVHDEGLVHPGATVIPAALAAAEAVGASGADLITAIVAGYEVIARIGMAAGGSHNLRGFHPTATHGTLGAAAAAAKLMCEGEDVVLRALGIAASFASGLMQFSKETAPGGGMVKRLHAGRAAENGVVAALLANQGLTSVELPLEGDFGYLKATSDDVRPERISDRLGDGYEILRVTRKPYPCCRFLHAAIDAILDLRSEYNLDSDTVASVDVGVSRRVLEGNSSYDPESVMAAQYMMPFNVAAALVDEIGDPRIYEKLDPRSSPIQVFARNVRLHHDARMEEIFPLQFGAALTLRLSDGTQLSRVVTEPKGSPVNPLTSDEITAKFMRLASSTCTSQDAERIARDIGALEGRPSLAGLFSLDS